MEGSRCSGATKGKKFLIILLMRCSGRTKNEVQAQADLAQVKPVTVTAKANRSAKAGKSMSAHEADVKAGAKVDPMLHRLEITSEEK